MGQGITFHHFVFQHTQYSFSAYNYCFPGLRSKNFYERLTAFANYDYSKLLKLLRRGAQWMPWADSSACSRPILPFTADSVLFTANFMKFFLCEDVVFRAKHFSRPSI